VPDAADDRYELPVTVDLLADLQAGLLDDRTAARLRRRVRTDPAVKAQLAALDRVRRNLSALAVDSASATDVPADVTATIGKALRSAPPPTP
jgi:anti-sigma factor RsiW